MQLTTTRKEKKGRELLNVTGSSMNFPSHYRGLRLLQAVKLFFLSKHHKLIKCAFFGFLMLTAPVQIQNWGINQGTKNTHTVSNVYRLQDR